MHIKNDRNYSTISKELLGCRALKLNSFISQIKRISTVFLINLKNSGLVCLTDEN